MAKKKKMGGGKQGRENKGLFSEPASVELSSFSLVYPSKNMPLPKHSAAEVIKSLTHLYFANSNHGAWGAFKGNIGQLKALKF